MEAGRATAFDVGDFAKKCEPDRYGGPMGWPLQSVAAQPFAVGLVSAIKAQTAAKPTAAITANPENATALP
jgi:hypothetical protein